MATLPVIIVLTAFPPLKITVLETLVPVIAGIAKLDVNVYVEAETVKTTDALTPKGELFAVPPSGLAVDDVR